jgi:pimeloyl-ACP methyl ester carboxylesterase
VNKELEKKENFFIGHGFGGSSLMNFPLFTDLLERGNVILMEIRGMGFSDKL